MYFLDTNILLEFTRDLDSYLPFAISSVSLEELEDIKTNRNKTEDVRYAARQALHWLEKNRGEYDVVVYDYEAAARIKGMGVEDTPDNRLLSCCLNLGRTDTTFVTNDLSCRLIAEWTFGIHHVQSAERAEIDYYTGYTEVLLPESGIASLYGDLTANDYSLLTGEYLIIRDQDGALVDLLRWNGSTLQTIKIGNIKSDYFGVVKAYKGDPYQLCALNSLATNKVTMLKGKAGTGKSYLALGYLFYLLDKKKIDCIVVFCNTVATANAAKLGYYPGSKNEKLLDSSIGNMLSSKVGGTYALERLINEGKVILLPMSDIRGYDTTNMHAGVYITEAQNMDIPLMKLALQRIGEDCICIIDGDYNAQVDLAQYAGSNNGMRRMSEVFRGQDFYGEVELKNIYRSKIAEVADKM